MLSQLYESFCPIKHIHIDTHNSKYLRKKGKIKELTFIETYIYVRHLRYIILFNQVSTIIPGLWRRP